MLQVVAAENFWGSIASQLGGDRVAVQSIIVNPSTDPHSYEPTASDAITLAGGKLVIVNGIGYDNWASQLVAANPVGGRVVVDVGDLLGLKDGDNPSPAVQPRQRPEGDRRDRRRLRPARPRRQRLLRGAGLRLLTPYSFAKAIAEGANVSASDVETVDRQAQQHQIKVWVFNSQNVTPEVQHINALAQQAHIAIATVTVTVTETSPPPPTASSNGK